MKEIAVGEFVDKVEGVYEVDFGDFKRKMGLYIMRLEEALGDSSKPVISKMKSRAIYHGDGDIEATRQDLLDLVKEI